MRRPTYLRTMAAGLLLATSATAQQQAGVTAPQNSGTSPFFIREMSVDGAYVMMMVQHEEQGLEMARIAARHAEHPELRLVAERLVADQQRDLDELHRLRSLVVHDAQPAIADEKGQADANQAEDDPDTQQMMERLRNTPGRDFDVTFVRIMVAHEQIAAEMSRNTAGFRVPDVRAFAQRIAEKAARQAKELKLFRRIS